MILNAFSFAFVFFAKGPPRRFLPWLLSFFSTFNSRFYPPHSPTVFTAIFSAPFVSLDKLFFAFVFLMRWPPRSNLLRYSRISGLRFRLRLFNSPVSIRQPILAFLDVSLHLYLLDSVMASTPNSDIGIIRSRSLVSKCSPGRRCMISPVYRRSRQLTHHYS